MHAPQPSHDKVNDPSHVPNPQEAPDPGPPDDGRDSAGGPDEWEPDEFVVERGGYGVGTDI